MNVNVWRIEEEGMVLQEKQHDVEAMGCAILF